MMAFIEQRKPLQSNLKTLGFVINFFLLAQYTFIHLSFQLNFRTPDYPSKL